MTPMDWIVLLILAVSAILGLVRGLVQEIFSLLAWVMAFVSAKWGAVALAPVLPIEGGNPQLRYFVAFALVFLGMMIVVLLLGRVVKSAAKAAGLGGVDRVVGTAFGFARGVVILIGLTLAAGLTALPQTDFWKKARFSGALELMVTHIEPWLPGQLSQHIHYR